MSARATRRGAAPHPAKTTQKLIDAAAQLSEKIVGYFGGCEDNTEVATVQLDGQGQYKRHGYVIRKGQLCIAEYHEPRSYVAVDRDNALVFSKDVASGVLEAISETALAHRRESTEALSVIENALKR